MRALLSSFAILGLAASAAPAFASYSEPAAGLQCLGNSIAVRFGRAYNGNEPEFEPLPQAHEAPWKDVAVAANNHCVLADGRRVELHDGRATAYPWGMGGGDPDGFLSLWVDGRKVTGKEIYYHGYGSDEPATNSIYVSGNTIERCVYSDHEFFRRRKEPIVVNCTQKRIDIAALPKDSMLPPESERALIGTISVASTHSPEFCARFVRKPEKGSEVTRERVEIPEEAELFFQSEPVAPPPSKDGSDYVRPHAWVDRFDLWNSGKKNAIVRFSGDWKFFMGDVLFYRQGPVSEADTKALTSRVEESNDGNDEPMAKLANELGWQTLPEKSDRNTNRTPFRLSGTTFILEASVWDTREHLYKTIPDFSRSDRLEEVCTFQTIEEYF